MKRRSEFVVQPGRRRNSLASRPLKLWGDLKKDTLGRVSCNVFVILASGVVAEACITRPVLLQSSQCVGLVGLDIKQLVEARDHKDLKDFGAKVAKTHLAGARFDLLV